MLLESALEVGAETELRRLAPLLFDEDERVRIAAVKGVSGIDDAEIRQSILAIAESNPSYRLKIAAVSQLPRLGSETKDLLLRMFPYALGRLAVAIIEALGQVDLASLIEELLSASLNGRKVKKAAIEAAAAAQSKDAVLLLKRLAGDPNQKVAKIASAALDRLPGSLTIVQ